jgi:AcrR family transcriptional regulator
VNEKTQDRRVRKTKKALRDGLAVLMTEKNIRDITVRELCDLVDLNRGTFYLHYRDVFDLQQQIENEVVEEINEILEQHMPGENQQVYALLVELLHYIKENASLCNMLLGSNNNNSFLDKLCLIIENRCLSIWLEQHRFQNSDEENLSYFCSYVVHGYVAVIAKWARTGMVIPPEQLSRLMGNMGMYGIGFLQR